MVIEQGDERINDLAMSIDKIFWFCQPIVSMEPSEEEVLLQAYDPEKQFEVVGYELLARTMSDTGGTISAWNLIQEINQHDELVRMLDRRTIRFAVRKLKANKANGVDTVYFVNLNGATIEDPEFIGFIVERLHELKLAGISPAQLRFEVTEHRPYPASGVLALRSVGLFVGADDYGEGFNSLAAIDEVDFDFIKIGGKFSKGLLNGSRKNLASVKSVLVLAKELGIPVVFESVETELIQRYIFRVWLSDPVFQSKLWGQGYKYGKEAHCKP